MRSLSLRVFALVAASMLSAASTGSAQNLPKPWAGTNDERRVDLSASMGFLMPTEWSSLILLGSISSASGITEQILSRQLTVDPDKAYGGAVTYWEGRYGFRVQGDYSKSTLKVGGGALGPTGTTSGSASVPIKTWLYDARGVIGFFEYDRARKVWPYGFVGFGGITYDIANIVSPPLTIISVAPPVTASRNIIISGDGRQFVLSETELGRKTVFSLSIGIGTDLRIPFGPAGIGLRLEASDRLASSPLAVNIRELGVTGAFVSDSPVRFGLVHHLNASAGFVLHIGR